MTEWLLVGVGLALVAVCGVFVAAEFSLLTVDRALLQRAVTAGEPGAAGTMAAVRSLSTQLSGAQVGITLTNLGIGFVAEPSIARLVDGPLLAVGLPESAVGGVALTFALLMSTAVTMVFGELVPKNLAITHPLGVAKVTQVPQRAFTAATRPLTAACNGAANWVVRALGAEPREELPSARAPQELASLVRRSARAGMVPEPAARLLERSLQFDDKKAADVLTPRTQMVAVAAVDPVQRVIDLARTRGHSRFPVLGDGPDDVLGVVQLSRAVSVPAEERARATVREVMDDVVGVPHSMALDELLWTLRDADRQLAVVVDEYGGTAGVVSLEDLLEELVGAIEDEHDPGDTAAHRTGNGGWVVSGLLRPDEVRELTGTPLPETARGHETVAGLVIEALDRIPQPGDRVDLGGVTAVVERMDRHRIDRLRLLPRTRGEREHEQS